METIKTNNFTAKDRFNSATATPIKEAKGDTLTITDAMVTENSDNQVVGYMKVDDGTIYATISATIIDQLIPLIDILNSDGEQDIQIVTKTSNGGREYFMLELQ